MSRTKQLSIVGRGRAKHSRVGLQEPLIQFITAGKRALTKKIHCRVREQKIIRIKTTLHRCAHEQNYS